LIFERDGKRMWTRKKREDVYLIFLERVYGFGVAYLAFGLALDNAVLL
jgi:hypothetical protein